MAGSRARTVPINPEVIEQLRLSKGLSEQQLADRCGFPVRTLQRWLQGQTRPFLSNAMTLASALGTPLDAIRGDIPTPSPDADPPCRFTIQISVKGQLRSLRDKSHLVRLTQEIIESLEHEGVIVTGHKTVMATSGFAGSGEWRMLIAISTAINDEAAWAVLALRPSRIHSFAAMDTFDDQLGEGELVSCGWGLVLPDDERERIAKLYRCGPQTIRDLTVPIASSDH